MADGGTYNLSESLDNYKFLLFQAKSGTNVVHSVIVHISELGNNQAVGLYIDSNQYNITVTIVSRTSVKIQGFASYGLFIYGIVK